jgi:hypothetical protein
MLENVDSSTSLLEVTTKYAAQFYDLYGEVHTGNYLSGDRMRILLLKLPFLFRDLVVPEVMLSCIGLAILYLLIQMISYVISYNIIDIICDIIYDNVSQPQCRSFLFVNEAIRKAQPGSPLPSGGKPG